jgi:hypothetical protein
MQATIGKQQFHLSPRRLGFLVAAVLVASLLLGAGALLATNTRPLARGHAADLPALKAYANAGQGEGRLGPALPAAAPRLKAVANVYAGEGRMNVASATAAQLVAQNSPYMGEGRLNVRRQDARPYAVTSCGQGEGFLDAAIHVTNYCR